MSRRTNLDILRLFEKASRENKITDDNTVKVEDNSSRKRDTDVSIHSEEPATAGTSQAETKMIFNVVYGKRTSKKHKTWSGDALLEITGKTAVLRDLDGNVMGRTTIDPCDAAEGFTFFIGNQQIEIIERVSQESSVAEKFSDKTAKEPLQKRLKTSTFMTTTFESPIRQNSSAPVSKEAESVVDSSQARIKIIFNVMYGKISSRKHKKWDSDGSLEVTGKSAVLKDSSGNVIGRTTVNPVNVVEGSTLIVQNKQLQIMDRASQELVEPQRRSDNMTNVQLQERSKPSRTRAFKPLLSFKDDLANCEPLVMPYMDPSAIWVSDKNPQKEQEVSVDLCLAAKLREHQRHGIVFLYECLMGLRTPDHLGAILADDMGLGKTLQCITLIWTLLKKGPYGKPVLKRVLIITPSSLCNNWNKEFVKWLGSHRISPYVVEGKNRVKDFTKYPNNAVMIVSYEMLMRCSTEINKIMFDLIVCDEGHRIKNSNAKIAKLLNELNCKRRIILTGTPIQNDLKEFYALIDFINPGILGTTVEYKNYYEDPIVASQCPHANAETLCLGNERATELHRLTKRFVLKRTQETINQYLPRKHEIVLFCSLSNTQTDLYVRITDAWYNKICMQDKTTKHLSVITALKKICNHPNLLLNDKESMRCLLPQATRYTEQMKQNDDNFTEYCGKVTVVQALMRNLKKTNEKLVLVSYYTQTLRLLETICDIEGLKFSRLDGTIQSSARSKIIEQFNTQTDEKVFLLSAKAGGVGLNLSGASRLVLFDSDWNPASDAQAMARIWRDGQKRDAYIYRLLMTGTIEEKIYQRQISKAGLSGSVVDLNHLGSLKLSIAELKNLFSLTTNTVSLTHDLMNCPCSGRNNEHLSSVERNESTEMRDCQLVLHDKPSQQNLTINQLPEWQHYKQPFPTDLMRDIMLMEVTNEITYIFKSSTVSLSSQHVQLN